MAFTQYNLSTVSASLNQGVVVADIDTPSSDTSTTQGSGNVYSYLSTTDNIATISASDYFVSQVYNFQVGDVIFVTGSDYSQLLLVTTVTLPTLGNNGTVNTSTYLPQQTFVTAMTTTALTNAQLLGMYATPVSVVPAQGSGSLILVTAVVIDYAYSTAATANGGAISLQYGNTDHAGGVICTETIAAATLNGFTANGILFAAGSGNGGVSTATLNTAIYISNATGAFITGAGTATVYTYYRVLTGLS